MKIGEIFRHDLDREIKEIIKVDDADLDDVAEEFREYVVTDHIHDAFIELLDQYQESINKPSEAVNAWVSGFFGSGKSSFAKVLGYIAANTDLGGTTAAEVFTAKLPTQQVRALLNTIHTSAPTFSVFVDLSSSRNVAKEERPLSSPCTASCSPNWATRATSPSRSWRSPSKVTARLDDFIAAFKRRHRA